MKRLTKLAAAMTMVGALVAGCGGGGGGSTVTAIDNTPPVVIYTTPVNNETAVGTNSKITITFSEAMDPASVTTSSFQLIDITTNPATPVTFTTVYDQGNRIATLTPSAPLNGTDHYRATVKRNVKDQAGNPLAADYTWTFQAAAGPDITPPVVNSVAPADLATGIGTTTSVAMSFSEPMNVASVVTAFSLKKTGTVSSVAGALAFVGEVATFTPSAPLEVGTSYTATLTTAATDLTGLHLLSEKTWSFTTGAAPDIIPPTVKLPVIPADGATNVPRGTSISVTFSEPIYPEIFGSINGIPNKVVVDYSTNTITMTPTAPLAPISTYQFRVRARDLSGNQMTVANTYLWTFTTGP